jgi:hypothetical protein
MQKVWNWFLARLSEPSTWAGISSGSMALSVALQSKAGLGAAAIAAVVAFVKSEQSQA